MKIPNLRCERAYARLKCARRSWVPMGTKNPGWNYTRASAGRYETYSNNYEFARWTGSKKASFTDLPLPRRHFAKD